MNKYFVPVVLLAGMLMSPAVHPQTMERTFVPEEVFAGRTEGKGTLILLGNTRSFTVESQGTLLERDQLRLEQNIRFAGRPAKARSWVMWQTAPGHYNATLTGAAGPVIGHTQGRRLTLRYPLKRWGLVMHQTLDLSHDGRTVENYGSIRFMGVPIGQLRETIQLNR